MFFYYKIADYFRTLSFIFRPFVTLPSFTINVIKRYSEWNFLDHRFFTLIQMDSYGAIITLIISGAIYFSLFATILSGKKETPKKILFYFLSIYFSIFVMHSAFYAYKKYGGATGGDAIIVGSSNLQYALGFFSMLIVYIFSLTKINKEMNLRYLLGLLFEYLVLIIEIFLAIVVSFILIERVSAPEANLFDKIYTPFYFITLGFILFIMIKLLEKLFKKILERG